MELASTQLSRYHNQHAQKEKVSKSGYCGGAPQNLRRRLWMRGEGVYNLPRLKANAEAEPMVVYVGYMSEALIKTGVESLKPDR